VLPNAGAPNGGFNPAGWTNPDGVGQGWPITYFDSSTGGSGLKASPTTNQKRRFTYPGKEAGFTNTSYIIGFNGDVLFNAATAASGDSKTVFFNGRSLLVLCRSSFTRTLETRLEMADQSRQAFGWRFRTSLRTPSVH
jgi:hypothetical protein